MKRKVIQSYWKTSKIPMHLQKNDDDEIGKKKMKMNIAKKIKFKEPVVTGYGDVIEEQIDIKTIKFTDEDLK